MPKNTAQGAIAFSGSVAGTTGLVAVGWATDCAMAGLLWEFASHLGGAQDDGHGSDSPGAQGLPEYSGATVPDSHRLPSYRRRYRTDRTA
ncbi:hypothetical protein GCM10022207_45580 [Streptomyces lannensis]|uniref:Uncharacterized protein n=1 Tax=Streptomyces lannensis TaxID=766498 RepID=A0ABP7KE82_9ACTN